jgi:hypothetical protein
MVRGWRLETRPLKSRTRGLNPRATSTGEKGRGAAPARHPSTALRTGKALPYPIFVLREGWEAFEGSEDG